MKTSGNLSKFKRSVVYVLAYCMFFNSSLQLLFAGPEGAQVVNGQVTFQQSGYNTVVTASDKSIINYSSFDIARPEVVEFVQPGSSASVLNRILSARPTNINGTLLANGRVFFVNPAGVYFGRGAVINVNQLVAAAHDITNSDFINGNYKFFGGYGDVINRGDIIAEKVALIAKNVANYGNITCPDGFVVMAAGDRVFLGEEGSDVIVEINPPSLPQAQESAGTTPAVLNEGVINAAGGKIILAAAGDIYSQAISNVGSLSVSKLDNAGQIKLVASDGQITNAGEIEASGQTGGAVTIDGDNVTLTAESAIHADGINKGGMVEILADTLVADGVITASGPEGAYGLILLDPAVVTIDDVLAGNIVTALAGANYNVVASDTINVEADIDSSSQTSSTTLSLNDENTDDNLTVNLNKSITLGVNQTLTGDGTTVNVLSEDASIQNGIDVSADGATITVADGTYTEDLTVNKSDLTLQSVNGRDDTTIQLVDGVGVNIGSGGTGFTLGGSSLSGFEILSGGATTFDVQLENAPSDVEISWNTINTTGNATMGISVGAAGATGLNVNKNIFTAGDLGDGSIWGPDMIDVSVSDNTFIGPAAKAASGYAVQFSGMTGTSLIQDNTINDYGMGIVMSNGTGTDGLEIKDNTVDDCRIGVLLAQYSPGTYGDMDNVTITDNILTNNTTGLQINDGANIKAGNFTIQNNSFMGNTTGLANNHTTENISATQNYWGNVDGPSGIGPGSGDPITVVVADSVDYSPWWGGNYIGDPHTTTWIWGTDDSIQDAIDLASTTVADRINVTAGIYSETVNVDKQLAGLYFMGDGSVDSEIDGSLTLSNSSANWDGGVLGISTDADSVLTLNLITDTGVHSLTLDTGAETTNLDENVTVGQDLTLTSDTVVAAGKKLDAGRDVILIDGKSLDGEGALTVEADRDITLGGATEAAGTLVLTADGESVPDGTGNLHARSTVKTTVGDIDADGVDITFDNSVEADGSIFADATGKLWAKSTLWAKGGDVALSASDDDTKEINLDDNVDALQDILLKNDTKVAAGKKLDAGRDVLLSDGKTLDGEGALKVEADHDIILGGATEAAGTLVLKADADNSGGVDGGTMWAKSTVETTAGDIDIYASDSTIANIDLDDDVDAAQDLLLHNNTVVEADTELKAGNNIILTDGKTITAEGSMTLEATGGGTVATAGKVNIDMAADDTTLTLNQNDAVDMADFTVTNSENTDLVANSTSGYVSAVIGDDNPADAWKSIMAMAGDYITLEGLGDITTKALHSTGNNGNISVQSIDSDLIVDGDVTADTGGVSLLAKNGRIYTSGGNALDVAITGYSDDEDIVAPVGVDLPVGFGEKAAIKIISLDDLYLGEDAVLTADGQYYSDTHDQRDYVRFRRDGEPIDVAIYVASIDDSGPGTGNIEIGSSAIVINNGLMGTEVGTLIFDAFDTVTFTPTFEDSLSLAGASDVVRLEVVSRYSQDIAMAMGVDRGGVYRLPYADNTGALAGGEFQASGGQYILRGTHDSQLLTLAKILELTDSAPLVPPSAQDAQDNGEVDETLSEALLRWLAGELGESELQAFLRRAYPPSLRTDLRPYRAAARLKNFATILLDTEGTQIAALGQVVAEFVQTDAPPSEEQIASFAQAMTLHKGDTTHYAVAGQWLDAMVGYVGVLNMEIGWSIDKSVAFAQDKYAEPITASGDTRTAMFLQTYLGVTFGG